MYELCGEGTKQPFNGPYPHRYDHLPCIYISMHGKIDMHYAVEIRFFRNRS